MGRYADVTCSKCYQVYPGNMMKRVTDRVKVGETRLPGSNFEDRTDQYENRVSILCPECIGSRRRMSCLGILAIVGIPAVFLGLYSVPNLVKSGALPKNDITESLSKAGQVERKLFREGAASPSTKKVIPAESTGALSTDADTAAVTETAEPAAVDQSSSAEVQEAVQQAASKGKRIKWRNAYSKGYAVPSSPNEVGCRNVYITDKNMGKDWQSPVQTICPEGN